MFQIVGTWFKVYPWSSLMYPSSHNHGSGKQGPAWWVESPKWSCSTSMIMGERVNIMNFSPSGRKNIQKAETQLTIPSHHQKGRSSQQEIRQGEGNHLGVHTGKVPQFSFFQKKYIIPKGSQYSNHPILRGEKVSFREGIRCNTWLMGSSPNWGPLKIPKRDGFIWAIRKPIHLFGLLILRHTPYTIWFWYTLSVSYLVRND